MALKSKENKPKLNQSKVEHKCNNCDKKFKSKSTLHLHEMSHKKMSEEEKYRCNFCDHTFVNKYNRKAHEKASHSNGKYHTHTCSTCSKKFLRKDRLQKHMKVHTQEKSPQSDYKVVLKNSMYHFICRLSKSEDCGKLIRYLPSKLKYHYETHHSKTPSYQPYACKIKIKKPINRPILKYAVVLQNGLSHFCCRQNRSQDCGKLIRYLPKNLKYHYMTYHSQPEDLEYACKCCEMKFPIEPLLKDHNKIHDSQYGCPYCGKRFESKACRQRHEKSHKKVLSEEKYQCQFCDRKYTSKYNGKAHEKRMHDSNNKYHTHTCSICNKSFVFKTLLHAHMKVHTQDKSHANFECNICQKTFKTESGIRFHRQKMHNLVNICGITDNGKICRMQFSSSRGLLRHQRDIHNMIVNINGHSGSPVKCKTDPYALSVKCKPEPYTMPAKCKPLNEHSGSPVKCKTDPYAFSVNCKPEPYTTPAKCKPLDNHEARSSLPAVHSMVSIPNYAARNLLQIANSRISTYDKCTKIEQSLEAEDVICLS